MDITVAICTWNRANILRATLENLLKLKTPARTQWELVLVDNNSSDDTANVIAEFEGRLPIRSFHEPRQGHTYARNRALAEARGTWVVWTDDDVAPEENWLEATWQAFRDFDADFVYGKIKPQWPEEAPSWYGYEAFHGKFALLDLGDHGFVATRLEQTFFGANHAGRRDAFLRLGGYREDVGLVGEVGGEDDTELFERALNARAKIVYQPDSLVWHVIDPKRCKKNYHRRRAWNSKACYVRCLKMKRPVPAMWLGLPRYLYRIAGNDFLQYLNATVQRNFSRQFYLELKLILFAGALKEAASSFFGGGRRTCDDEQTCVSLSADLDK